MLSTVSVFAVVVVNAQSRKVQPMVNLCIMVLTS